MNDTFIDWRLGTRAQFDAIAPLGGRLAPSGLQRPVSLEHGRRPIVPPGQRTRVDDGLGAAAARFKRLRNTDKLGIALRSAAACLEPEARGKLAELTSPTQLAIMAGALAIWICAQATPIGWVVDIGMAGLGVVALGSEAVAVLRELHAFAMGVVRANSEAELAQTGRHLAKAVAIVGVDVVMALLLKKAVVKVRRPVPGGGEDSGTKLFGKYDAKDAARSLGPEKKPQLTEGSGGRHAETDIASASTADAAKGIKESLHAVNLPARIKASGMGTADAGKLFGWGPAGRMEKPLSAFSKESLEAAGWTRDTVSNVAQGYREIARITPGNPSALPRAEQLESLLDLWK